MGTIWDVCMLYGSHVHWTGAIWEPDCTTWKEDGAIWESTCTKTELQALYGSQMVPYGSHMQHMRQTKAVCTVGVLCAPYWRQMVSYESRKHCVGTMWEPCAPCWSHVCHLIAM
jgi:hypothetical protein